MTAMGLPGGGRMTISTRLMRHFNVIGFAQMSDDSINFMFRTITEMFYNQNLISEEVKGMI